MESVVIDRKNGGSAVDPFWEEARDVFLQDLSQNKSSKIDDTTRLEDTIKTLKLTQSKTWKEYRTHTLYVGSKDVEIKVGRIMRRLELILRVGDAATRFGPETVSLVWSVFRMVFTVCIFVCHFHRSSADQITSFRDFSRIQNSALPCSMTLIRFQAYCLYARHTSNDILGIG